MSVTFTCIYISTLPKIISGCTFKIITVINDSIHSPVFLYSKISVYVFIAFSIVRDDSEGFPRKFWRKINRKKNPLAIPFYVNQHNNPSKRGLKNKTKINPIETTPDDG